MFYRFLLINRIATLSGWNSIMAFFFIYFINRNWMASPLSTNTSFVSKKFLPRALGTPSARWKQESIFTEIQKAGRSWGQCRPRPCTIISLEIDIHGLWLFFKRTIKTVAKDMNQSKCICGWDGKEKLPYKKWVVFIYYYLQFIGIFTNLQNS